jgi:adenylate cyclase
VSDPDFEPLLEGLDGDARQARLRLLTDLHADGCSMDELRRAVDEERLVLLPVDRVFNTTSGELTRRDIAERAGVDLDDMRRSRAAFGLTTPDDDDPAWGDNDLEQARALKAMLDAGVPMEKLVELNRVIGRAMLQVAAASRRMVADAVLSSERSEYEAALAVARAARELTPRMAPVLAYTYEAHSA